MTNMPSPSGQDADRRRMVVAEPRAYDAMGSALRDAYCRDAGIPDDMLNCLSQLDRKTDPRSN